MSSLRLAAVVLALAVVWTVFPGPLRAQTTGPALPDRAYFPSSGSSNPLVTEGDRFYGRRQEGRIGMKASVTPINQAISSYDRAAEAPDLVDA